MKKISISIFGLFALLMTSCSLFKNDTLVVKADDDIEKTTVTTKNSEKKKKKKSKKSSATPLMPQVAAGQEEKTAYQVEISEQVLNGEWTIAEVFGEKVTGEERPYVNFSVSEKRFYGSNGCNIINGDYAVSGNGLTFDNVITSMKSCDNALFEYKINNAINQVRSYSVERIGNEYYLSLLDEKKIKVLILRKHNMDYLNGAWKVMTIEGKSFDGEDLQLVIDIPELRMHGHTGCNIVNGQLLIDPDKNNSIQFHQLISTLMSCHNQQAETAFLVALEEVESAKKGEDDTALFYDKAGEMILVLKRIVKE